MQSRRSKRDVPIFPADQIVANRHALVPQRAGGLDRMYYSLVGALPGAGVEVRGLRRRLAEGRRRHGRRDPGFGPASESLARRMLAARRALREEIRSERPDVISSHFALYTFPGLDVTRGIPQVSHFQGPWADESWSRAPHRSASARSAISNRRSIRVRRG